METQEEPVDSFFFFSLSLSLSLSLCPRLPHLPAL